MALGREPSEAGDTGLFRRWVGFLLLAVSFLQVQTAGKAGLDKTCEVQGGCLICSSHMSDKPLTRAWPWRAGVE